MLDVKTMFDRLVKNRSTEDIFIERRMKFIDQIIQQRNLDVRYQTIDPVENKASQVIIA